MRRLTWMLAMAFVCAFTAVIQSQQDPVRPPGTPAWAFAINDAEIPDPTGDLTLPGSTKTYTFEEIDDQLNPPDWYPDEHPPAPEVVVKGEGDRRACGSCHLMSGSGHPESTMLTGLSADYIVQQLMDFKSGARIDFARMNPIAKAMTEEDMRAAAGYFSSLPRQPFQRVIEADMVPRTIVAGGRMRFVHPDGGMEPIGNRVITVPEDMERARRRDPKSGFVSYVPVGSLARGKELVETGGGKTVACGICHGANLQGQGNIPRLAGSHPAYTARQLYIFKDGTRNGAGAALMKTAVEQLTDEDIVAISGYLASLPPGSGS